MNRLRRACCLGLLAAAVGHAASAPSAAEQTRIDRLLDAVSKNASARFIRNGNDYSGADAAVFLRRKLQAFGGDVKTAEDFIDQIATKSSTSGRLYTVRLADGREIPSAVFLKSELSRIEAGR
ncbi:MAG: DUF5329 family protein [Pseudomonadota bacterium]